MQETTSFGIMSLRQNAPVPLSPPPPQQQHIEDNIFMQENSLRKESWQYMSRS